MMAEATDISSPGATNLPLVRRTIRLRLCMMRVNDLIKQKAFQVPIHLAFGHESIAVAVVDVMGDDDRLLLTHRNIHYNIARNPHLSGEIDEYRLLESGLGGGRFGAMNLTNPTRGIVYTSSILGNCLPVATGVAKGLTMRGGTAATVAVTGDGGMEEGAFYEAVMLACSLSLPIVFLVENNQWSMHTRIEERRCPIDLQKMADAFAIPYDTLSGGDPVIYSERLRMLRAAAVARRRPCIIEVALSTLGDYWLEEPGRERRHVNYHHGPVASLSYGDDPVIEPSERDPLHVLAQRFSPAEWSELVAAERALLEAESP
jgi:TPP-dependent pyruvate/acetoin dehydrogenase alpha subunit